MERENTQPAMIIDIQHYPFRKNSVPKHQWAIQVRKNTKDFSPIFCTGETLEEALESFKSFVLKEQKENGKRILRDL